jgi:hypothetical protein
MTDPFHVRRLSEREPSQFDAASHGVRTGPAAGVSDEASHPLDSTVHTVGPMAPAVVCRTANVRVNLARLLADLEVEARRLLGGALCD